MSLKQETFLIFIPSSLRAGGMCHFPVGLLKGEQHLSGGCSHLGAGKGLQAPLQVFHGQQQFDLLFHSFPPSVRFSRQRHPLSIQQDTQIQTGVTGSEANWLSRKLSKCKAIILMICDQAKGDSISGVSLVPCSQPGWRCQVNSEGAVPGSISPV